MGVTNQDKMHYLLEQIQFPHELIEPHFRDSTMEKLTVYRETKEWHFHFKMPQPLPPAVYELFTTKLQSTFRAIAEVKWTIETDNKEMEESDTLEYWNGFIKTMTNLSPGYKDLLLEQQPEITGNKIMLTCRNLAESHAVKKKLEEPLQSFCVKSGLPPYMVSTRVKEEQEQIKKFQEERQKEDKKIVQQAVKDQEERAKEKDDSKPKGPIEIGYKIQEDPEPMENIQEEERRKIVQGYVFEAEVKELRSGRFLLLLKVTDYTDSFSIKMFSRGDDHAEMFKHVKQGLWIKARGSIQTDNFTSELTMMANDINEIKPILRKDEAPEGEKRIELHSHTTMSQMDAPVSPGRLIAKAAEWGHEAIAITDHAVVQAYPDAHAAGEKNGIKVIYGLEANLVDDGVPIAYEEQDRDLESDVYVVFDVETTGLSAVYDKIIELAAVKVRGGEIIDRFESFANPHQALSQTTVDLTGITDDMVKDAPEIEEVLKDFHQWMENDILVAHNASFDMGFLNAGFTAIGYEKAQNPVIDTLELARFLVPELKNHRLNTLCKKFDIELTQHHRAIYDAEATGYLLWKLVKRAMERGITNHKNLNDYMGEGKAYQRSRPSHCTLLATNSTGLKNIYKLVSEAHVDYFYRVPRIPRSRLGKLREGILVGSGCDKGEVFETIMQKSEEEAEKVADFYDYIEIQPPGNYYHLLEKDLVQNEAQIYDILKRLVAMGERLGKTVVATGNTHYVEPHEKQYRQIMIASQSGNPLNRQTLPDVHFKTTNEMVDELSFFGNAKAKELVVTNTRKIMSQIGEVTPVKEDLFTPNIEGADQEIREMSYNKAKSLYGDPIPELVEKRLEKELESIIGHGFAVIYLISQKLVTKSLEDGYLVGSRGSVGSSFVATMTDITEVNPLPPHYVCPACQFHEFFTDGSVGSGFDLPEKDCPECGTAFRKDGQDIPFETFLGFKGDKVPDIDLNFSGEYQPQAHNYTKYLFGEDNVFRAGTIGTIAEKTAYGYVKGYAGDHQLQYKNAEIDRLVQGCTGVKRTTGQHPGGIIVVPDDMEIYDFSPIQFPADDTKSEWRTTHFDFHSIHDNLLKLDILGHDDPTVIRMLQDLSGIDQKEIPVDDPEVMKIFSGPEALGVNAEQIMCKTGTLGVPEFGTRFVRQMLEDTKPSTFAELVIISGLSHGTDVWLGNAEQLINDGICTLPEVIGCRDDIMVYLMHKGLEPSLAFKIMEFVRKGRGLQDEWIEEMKKHGVPDWYIDSCKKIKYMFPKAHAAAYVLMAVRIAYFKVHYPIYFYAAYFTVRASDFELDTMVKGSEAIRKRIEEIQAKGLDATPKEKNLMTVLELSLEMCERGYGFKNVDLYESSATDFIVEDNQLIPPFNAVDGLGTNAAINIVKARKEGEFLSKQDLRERSRISKTVLEYLDNFGCLEGMPDENQLSLF
ncbi:PolC-type DNA polymerase III [Halobacillus halophilus]|uniref:DNA polymerase III PolC-type n=1 Tax=Halobacillus halophilus (strain ATCC 35676 / DSM 2266 / JCM 20832 / KCTC 3685 / LMG 17431 / NBRC 102448 / NCIMB 2269) TaxID=866895 RepID=I0JMQ0_HALH3|nr:PolC-type DNA polymerase III [Halobacillus halophilus]ASF39498.1 PolC-type DNA polymerase III [Halobacillus halophilus]CCG45420.1 DNA polymerase III (gram-positive type) [Halobacillus halophilus DSM 2266]